MLAGKGIIKREISQVLRVSGKSVKFLRRALGTHRFQRAVFGKDVLVRIKRPGSRLTRVE
jgi:DNA-binding CsgD family transcriptional regulator